jgi:hypothetical protein
MCRRPIYFKGFHKVEDKWNEDAWETRCSEAFENSIEGEMQNLKEMLIQWPREFHAFFLRKAMRHLKMNERMFSAMKEGGFDSDEIDYLLNETEIYFSRTFGSYIHDHPRREKVPYKPAVHKAMRFKKNNVR